ncbi:hypothetical protein M758_UG283400 [Ceratodon purpureus]|nr:hypothetical protein M758_UG283400 [Ceratodon purpureus]
MATPLVSHSANTGPLVSTLSFLKYASISLAASALSSFTMLTTDDTLTTTTCVLDSTPTFEAHLCTEKRLEKERKNLSQVRAAVHGLVDEVAHAPVGAEYGFGAADFAGVGVVW